jgi:acetoin utilization protein AcuB
MKVKDWMTSKVVTVSPDMSVKKAFALMKQNGFHHLPVVRADKPIGIVTDRDLRRPNISDVFKEWDQLYRLSEDIAVEDVMTTPAITVTPDTDLLTAASMLIERKINALPVVNGQGKLVGIVTTVDLLKAFVRSSSF